MTKKFDLPLMAAVGAALMLSACGDNGNSQQRVCADRLGRRIQDDYCQRSGPGAFSHWYYMSRGGNSYLPYGSAVSGGSYAAPAGVSSFRSTPTASVSRGIFGGSAHASVGE